METQEEARETDLGEVAKKAFEAALEDRATKPKPTFMDGLAVLAETACDVSSFAYEILKERLARYFTKGYFKIED